MSEAKKRSLRFNKFTLLLFVLAFAGIGAALLLQSRAQTSYVQIVGTVTKVDTNGNRLSYVANVTIETCLGTTTTGSNGYFTKDIPANVGFCVRTLNYNPGANYTGPFLRPWSEGYNGCRGYGGPPYSGYCPKPPYATINDGIQSGYEYQISGGYVNNGYDRNQDWGYDIVYVYTPPPPPPDTTKPTVPSGLSTTSATANSISIKWNTSSDNVGVKGYNVFRDGTKIGTTSSTSYTNAGLASNTTYSYSVSAYDAAGNTSAKSAALNVKTAGVTTAPPPSGGGPSGGSGGTTAPSPSGSGNLPTGSSSNTQTGNSRNPSQGAANPSMPPDTTPPSVPANFKASSEQGKSYVGVSWDASIDNYGIKSYELDRSTDNQNWLTIQAGSADTYFQDQDIQFNFHYFYRVRAIDFNGNFSDYALADLTTSSFEANVFPDKDNTITSDNIKVILPAGAVDRPLQCNVTYDNSTLSPNFEGYSVIEGPNQVLCKQDDGAIVSRFNKPLAIEWMLKPGKKVAGVQIYSFESDWKLLKSSAHDNRTYQFELVNSNVFVSMGKLKKTSAIVKIMLVLGSLMGVGVGALFFLRWKFRQKQQSALEDYWRKMTGG